ncbi:MAG: signal peptidase I [Proteobacteria bacterium]|nr:signal peptidase I [Pseudomonadota bacterium]
MLLALFRGLLKLVFLVATLLAIAGGILRYFFVDLAIVGHNSMAPTLTMGEQVAVWRDAELQLGDIALCGDPRMPGEYVIGRVAGKKGDELKSGRRGQLLVNGKAVMTNNMGTRSFYDERARRLLTMDYGTEKLGSVEHEWFKLKGHVFSMRTVKVKKGLFLLGDNRTTRSNDSRLFGSAKRLACRGKVFLRIRPAPGALPDDLGHGWLELLD